MAKSIKAIRRVDGYSSRTSINAGLRDIVREEASRTEHHTLACRIGGVIEEGEVTGKHADPRGGV